MLRLSFCIFSICILCHTSVAQVTIDATNWPYGSDQIGNYWDYYNTASPYNVNINSINPYQQGGVWDFSTGPTTSTASSEIMTVASSPTPRPANITYVEYQTTGTLTQWLYEDETAVGTWARGFRQGTTTYNYDAPQWNIYQYPMTYGTIWNQFWTWTSEAFGGIPVEETRNNEIVGWGTVTVPHGGPLQCLVIRTFSHTYLEFESIVFIDDTYRIYEWIVPGIGSVATIQSNVDEINWYFTQASGYFRLYDSNLGGDLNPPVITGVPDLNDTPNPGPYEIPATITDESGIQSALIYYSIQNAAFVSAPPTDVNGSQYTFEIPMMTGSPVKNIRYYIWARDNSVNQNSGTNPIGAPGTNYSFNWINDNLPPVFTNVTQWPSPTNFNGPFPVDATITDDNGVLIATLHFKLGGAAWDETAADGNIGDDYSFTIPAISQNTLIRYYLEAYDNSGFFNNSFHPSNGIVSPIIFQAIYHIPAPPAAVEDLVINYNNTEIELYWSAVTEDTNGNSINVTAYNIYRSILGDDSDWSFIDSSPTNYYEDTGAALASEKYFYYVTAVTP